MAEKDIAEKTFMSLNDVFADIFNVLVFNGKQIIVPDLLEDITAVSQYKADDDKLHEQERDTFKLWKGHGVNLILAGIENQTRPDKDMPFRIIGYDGASYRSQLLKYDEKLIDGEIKHVPSKERYPVITVVLYFGSRKWNYSTNLIDCFEPEMPDNEITEILKEYISDYRVNLFDIPRLSPEKVKLFRSDFRIVADYFVNSHNNEEYRPDDKVITHVDEFLKLMKVLTGDCRYEEIYSSFDESERLGGIRMCKVLDARERRGMEKGLERGKIEGAASNMISMVDNFVKKQQVSLEVALDMHEISMNEYEAAKALIGA